MADTKISALTASTTPLAGTEVLPIVQSGTTKQVSVANLTAGRAVAASAINVTNTDGSPVNITSSAVFGTVVQIASSGINGRTYKIQATASGDGTNPDGSLVIDDATAIARRLRLDPSGNFYNVAGNYVPSTAAKGVNFTANTPAAGMTSQLLNAYEEGVWTPTIGDGTNNYTAGNAYGFYTRIGNRVFVNGVVSWTSIGSAGGGQLLISLPIAVSATLFNRNGASLGYVAGLDNGGLKQITVAADGNTQRLSFWQLNDNAAPTAIAANSSSASGEVQFSVSYFV